MTIFLKNPEILFTFEEFQQKIMQLSQAMHLDLTEQEIDHLAIRVNEQDEAQKWLDLLLKYGTIISQNEVNGRPIYLIKLAMPITIFNNQVSVIELPFPKKIYPVTGWEHLEIVMPFLDKESIEDWEKRILTHYGWLDNESLKVKCSQPQVEGEQKPNPSIAVSFKESMHNHCCIKVHPYTIESIIEVLK
ncbi:metalloprotein [Actinobacillus delphinicola]|uniref:Uncharacterized protein conserved in bacteria n=1 Tax=Actinobacillus delphinicola TaxID=51161 RepID=A0A448TUK5_9PAST|nr:VOC family protein [Actinobacillus delphinicola]MDG6897806.1 metalloprotein [Actinobacillus delphinicola]VEJ09682.1 Uncharacterized protein conserved in bacteria [Actinobacillus delphinicola]